MRASPRSCAFSQRKQGLHEHHARRVRRRRDKRVAEVEPEWRRVDARRGSERGQNPRACFRGHRRFLLRTHLHVCVAPPCPGSWYTRRIFSPPGSQGDSLRTGPVGWRLSLSLSLQNSRSKGAATRRPPMPHYARDCPGCSRVRVSLGRLGTNASADGPPIVGSSVGARPAQAAAHESDSA